MLGGLRVAPTCQRKKLLEFRANYSWQSPCRSEGIPEEFPLAQPHNQRRFASKDTSRIVENNYACHCLSITPIVWLGQGNHLELPRFGMVPAKSKNFCLPLLVNRPNAVAGPGQPIVRTTSRACGMVTAKSTQNQNKSSFIF